MEGTAVRGRLTWTPSKAVDFVTETRQVRTIVFDVPQWGGHLAGQHVDVRLTAPDGYQAQRSYSIASPPEDGMRVALTIERIDDGEVSVFLVDDVMTGDEIELRGPIGGYFTWDAKDGGPLMLIGGGSGVVPLMAMLRHRAAERSTVPARLLYSARTIDDVIYRGELDRMAADDDMFMPTLTLTRAQPPGWTGPHRRVDREMLEEVVWPAASTPRVFICGPTPFVESVADILVGLGHEPHRIKTERFGPTGG
jgi:ferredoxin-NADP reductase